MEGLEGDSHKIDGLRCCQVWQRRHLGSARQPRARVPHSPSRRKLLQSPCASRSIECMEPCNRGSASAPPTPRPRCSFVHVHFFFSRQCSKPHCCCKNPWLFIPKQACCYCKRTLERLFRLTKNITGTCSVQHAFHSQERLCAHNRNSPSQYRVCCASLPRFRGVMHAPEEPKNSLQTD